HRAREQRPQPREDERSQPAAGVGLANSSATLPERGNRKGPAFKRRRGLSRHSVYRPPVSAARAHLTEAGCKKGERVAVDHCAYRQGAEQRVADGGVVQAFGDAPAERSVPTVTTRTSSLCLFGSLASSPVGHRSCRLSGPRRQLPGWRGVSAAGGAAGMSSRGQLEAGLTVGGGEALTPARVAERPAEFLLGFGVRGAAGLGGHLDYRFAGEKAGQNAWDAPWRLCPEDLGDFGQPDRGGGGLIV